MISNSLSAFYILNTFLARHGFNTHTLKKIEHVSKDKSQHLETATKISFSMKHYSAKLQVFLVQSFRILVNFMYPARYVPGYVTAGRKNLKSCKPQSMAELYWNLEVFCTSGHLTCFGVWPISASRIQQCCWSSYPNSLLWLLFWSMHFRRAKLESVEKSSLSLIYWRVKSDHNINNNL